MDQMSMAPGDFYVSNRHSSSRSFNTQSGLVIYVAFIASGEGRQCQGFKSGHLSISQFTGARRSLNLKALQKLSLLVYLDSC